MSTAGFVGFHVVEQHGAGAGAAGFFDLVEAIALDFDQPPRPAILGSAYGLSHGHGAQVVVLHQDAVREPGPVVVTAAGAHGRFLQSPKPRGGLAGVENPHRRIDPVHRGHVPSRQAGHPGEMAQEIERNPLRREHRGELPAHEGHRIPRVDRRPVGRRPGDGQRGVEHTEGFLGARPAGDDAGRSGHDGQCATGRGVEQRRAQVTERAHVLRQRPSDGFAHRGRRRVDVELGAGHQFVVPGTGSRGAPR
jgi:hypothetical protein